MVSNKNNLNKLTSLEFLRFAAALLVVMAHYNSYSNGFIGVNIFFILSGFVIMYATEKNSKYFFLRRLIRIIPLYWLLTLLFFIGLLFFPNYFGRSEANIIYFLKSLFFIPFENNGIQPGYGHSPYIFLGWTLNFEIFFYLIFQISMIINYKFRSSICILAIIFLNFVFNSIETDNFIIRTYSDSIILEFCFGITIFNIWKIIELEDTVEFVNLFLSIIASLLIIFYLYQDLSSFRFRTSFTALSIVFFFTLILRNISQYKILLLLGSVSYPLYLTHPYVREILMRLNDNYKLIESYNFLIIASLILSIIISYFLYYYVERIIIKFLNKQLLNYNKNI